MTGAVEGIPFPIPKQGVEVFWNHVLRYRGDAAARQIGQAPVTAGGDYTLVKFHDEFLFPYSVPGMTEAGLDNVIAYFIQETDRAGALRRRDPAGARDARSVQGESPRLGLQPRPAPRAPRAERRLRQSRHQLGQPAHL